MKEVYKLDKTRLPVRISCYSEERLSLVYGDMTSLENYFGPDESTMRTADIILMILIQENELN